MIHFAFFAANVLSIQISWKQYKLDAWNILKILQKSYNNDLEKSFCLMQKFWRCLFATQGGITLELTVFN